MDIYCKDCCSSGALSYYQGTNWENLPNYKDIDFDDDGILNSIDIDDDNDNTLENNDSPTASNQSSINLIKPFDDICP